MIGELDAIGCHSHPNANPVTGVAHACGHHAQMAAMIGCAIAMADPDVQKCLAGTVNFLQFLQRSTLMQTNVPD